MSYNDHHQYREDRSRSGSFNDDRSDYPPNYNSSRYPSSDPRRSNNWSSSSSSYDRRSEIPCRFGIKCRNVVCPYRHDSPPQQHRDSFDRRATIPCRHGMNCTRPHCPYKHESETSRSSPIPSNYSSLNSADDRRSSSIGRRFEPPPLVPPVREQPPEQSTLHTHSHLKQEFSKRFEPPSRPSRLQPSKEVVGHLQSISNDKASSGESQRRRLSFIPPNKSQETLDEKQSELQKRFVPNVTAATDADSLAKPQQITSRTKTASVDTNNSKTDNDKCENISEPKPIEVDMLSKTDVVDKESQNPEQIETNNHVTDNSNVESQPMLTEQQQQYPPRAMTTPVHSKNNGETGRDECDHVPKTKSVQKETYSETNNDVTDKSNVESQPRRTELQQFPPRTMTAPVHSKNNGETGQDKCDSVPKPKPVQKVINSLPRAEIDNEKCDISEPKPMEVDMLSKADVVDKDSQNPEQIETNNHVTDKSNVESKPRLTEQQQYPTRTMTAPGYSNNGETGRDKCDNVPKPKPVQKVMNSLPRVNTSANGTARKPEPKPNCAGNEKVRVPSQSTSTLANLLSSQRRSAAQLQRYRVQQARPFENIQHDFPIISTAPKISHPKETLKLSHVSGRLQDDVTNLKKNKLTKLVHKNDEKVPIFEVKDTTKGSKEPAITKLVARDTKAHTISTKKRKAHDMKSIAAADTNIAAAAAVAAKPRKKNKGVNPFRVKVGSVVSVRLRPLSEGGNPHVVRVARDEQSSKAEHTKKEKPKLFEVWSEPIAGRHDGLSLLGSRIKCVFMKSFVEKCSKKNTNLAANSLQKSVEGNVVSILGSDDDQHNSGIVVGLLVDREKIKSLPFLEVISDDTLSSSKLALKKIEDKIRGEMNVVVKVVLASVMDKRKGTKLNRGVVKQWVVRKRLLAQPSGKKPTKSERKAKNLKRQSLFIGDGNDKPQQQEKNWRWVAARAVIANSTNESNSIEFASQLVGQVTAMIVHEDPGKGGSLATVTIRRMWTPEQTKSGRMRVHGDLELFDDHYGEVNFQGPVEDLVVIGKSVSRQLEASGLPYNKNEERNFHITHSYNASDGTYKPLFGDVCDCRLCNPSNFELTEGAIPSLPPLDKIDYQYTADGSISSLVTSIKETVNPDNFALPNDVGSVTMRPSFIPNTGYMKSGQYSEAKSIGEDKTSQPRGKNKKRKRKKRVKSVHLDDDMHLEDEKDDAVKFKPTCSRTIPFDDISSDYWYLRNKKATSVGARREPSTREIARPRSVESKTKEEVSTLLTGRAARANQRRMVKSLGTASTGVDRLAGRDREQYLRFGKSTIEGWGVFAEEAINAGDLIIEYRGELIGHAVADKREREYEHAKIPDYMFRIDAFTVCDATRLGNVARFINASCSPNCYTQIITANENKRIVIYAKRNIARGEELCYDYKFPLEMDPAKRIPCGCGSIECRGYMNWDKRWD